MNIDSKWNFFSSVKCLFSRWNEVLCSVRRTLSDGASHEIICLLVQEMRSIDFN